MSSKLHLAHAAVTTALVAALVWSVGQQRQLAARMTLVEVQAGSVEAGSEATEAAGAPRSALAAAGARRLAKQQRRAEAAVDEAEVAEVVEATVEDALERRQQAQKAEATERWLDQASQGTLMQIEKLADAHDLSDAQVERTHELIIDGLYAGIDLKEAMNNGELTVREAVAEGNAIRAEMRAEMESIIGPELTEELGQAIRPGRGWDPD